MDSPSFHAELLLSEPALREKLVLHRGYHSIDSSYIGRPLENTRQAYLDAVKLSANFAECDVWVTADGVMVLCHDADFSSMVDDPEQQSASTPIAHQAWEKLARLKLKDGSTPVRLTTVLEDLLGTDTKLVIELKTSAAAASLGRYLRANAHLASCVAWMMSFSFDAVESFLRNGGRDVECRGAWLLDNPSEAYHQADLHEGETTYDCTTESFSSLLDRTGNRSAFVELRCGVYLQYNPQVCSSDFISLRTEMQKLFEADRLQSSPEKSSRGSAFLGIWSDSSLDPEFDRADEARQWLDVVDAVNTDIPHSFWAPSDFFGCPLPLKTRQNSSSTTASDEDFNLLLDEDE